MNENKWISVKDRLPEKRGKYLCVIKGCCATYLEILEFNVSKKKFQCYDWEYGGHCNIDNVTHWQELPPLPNQ